MRVVTLIIFLVIAGLVLPMSMAAGCFNLAIPDVEPSGYSLLEQFDFEEELYHPDLGGGITGLSASKAAWMKLRQHSHPLPPILPPPKQA